MYSQNDEEAHILKHLGHVPRGRLLDIGANDGCYLSNSLALIERGWSGVLVEANPLTFAKLVENHLDNPKLTLVNAAIGPKWKLTKFWTSTADGGRPDPSAALSTTESNQRQARAQSGQFREPFYVPMVPLDFLLNEFQAFTAPVDFVSIDTEGTSHVLFCHFPIEIARPSVICVEHDGRHELCRAHALRSGYHEVCCNAENLIFVQGSLL